MTAGCPTRPKKQYLSGGATWAARGCRRAVAFLVSDRASTITGQIAAVKPGGAARTKKAAKKLSGLLRAQKLWSAARDGVQVLRCQAPRPFNRRIDYIFRERPKMKKSLDRAVNGVRQAERADMVRVVITSTGVVSVGLDSKDLLGQRCEQLEHNFKPITSFDTSSAQVKCAAQIDEMGPSNRWDSTRRKRAAWTVSTQFAMAAARRLDSAGDPGKFDPFRAGVIVGSGIGGFQRRWPSTKFLEKGPDRVSVFVIPMMISNMAAGQIAIEYGF